MLVIIDRADRDGNCGDIAPFTLSPTCKFRQTADGPRSSGASSACDLVTRLAFWIAMGLCFVSIGSMWMASPRKVRVVAGQVERLAARKALAEEK